MPLTDPQLYLLIGTVMALAATLQSIMGFGFNLVAAPLLIAFLNEPAEVVPALHLSWVVVGLAITLRGRRLMSPKRIAIWLAAALPGAAIGVWLLETANPTILGRFIGTITVVATLFIAFKAARPLRREKPWMLVAGGLSGVLGGSTGMSGPPLVLLGLNQGWPTARFRADLLAYFTLLSAIAIVMYWWRDLLTATSLRYAAVGAPGLCIGFVAGTVAAKYVSGDRFRYAAIALICVTGITPWLKS